MIIYTIIIAVGRLPLRLYIVAQNNNLFDKMYFSNVSNNQENICLNSMSIKQRIINQYKEYLIVDFIFYYMNFIVPLKQKCPVIFAVSRFQGQVSDPHDNDFV